MNTLIGATYQNAHRARYRVVDVGWVASWESTGGEAVLCVELEEDAEVPGHWEAPAPALGRVCIPMAAFLSEFTKSHGATQPADAPLAAAQVEAQKDLRVAISTAMDDAVLGSCLDARSALRALRQVIVDEDRYVKELEELAAEEQAHPSRAQQG